MAAQRQSIFRDNARGAVGYRKPHRVLVRGDDGVSWLDVTERTFCIERFDDDTTDLSMYVKKGEEFVLTDDRNHVKTETVSWLSEQVRYEPL